MVLSTTCLLIAFSFTGFTRYFVLYYQGSCETFVETENFIAVSFIIPVPLSSKINVVVLKLMSRCRYFNFIFWFILSNLSRFNNISLCICDFNTGLSQIIIFDWLMVICKMSWLYIFSNTSFNTTILFLNGWF
jgi:hypothetical protein